MDQIDIIFSCFALPAQCICGDKIFLYAFYSDCVMLMRMFDHNQAELE